MLPMDPNSSADFHTVCPLQWASRATGRGAPSLPSPGQRWTFFMVLHGTRGGLRRLGTENHVGLDQVAGQHRANTGARCAANRQNEPLWTRKNRR
jgi:hypothetical protein